jgi:hypothetical protein
MQRKSMIQGLAAIWLLLFVMSFVSLEITESDGTYAGDLNRVAAFLTWQVLALGVAAIGAFATRLAVQRSVEGVKVFGYGPLVFSTFIVASFIAIVAYRVFVVPLFEAGGP